MADDLQCARCGAPVALPADYGAWLVRCPYCGFEHELADRAARQAFGEQRRREAERAAQAQAAAAQQQRAEQKSSASKRNLVLVLVALPVLLSVAVGGFILYVVNAAGSSISAAQVVRTPPAGLETLANAARAAGCNRVVDKPAFETNEYSSSFHLVKSECVRFLGVAEPAAALSLYFTDGTGAVTARPGKLGPFDDTFCPKTTGAYQVKMRGAPAFWVEAVSCPRTFGTDPDSTGKTKVGARLKQLMSHGCYQISLATDTFADERKLTTPLDAGTCFDLTAATGIPDNELTVTLSTPFGETVAPMPAPTNDLELAYCATSTGPHVLELSAAVDGPYSAAIAICTRAALPKLLPKALK